ncbi:MAG: histidinol-phosphatase HisJ family protein [Fibrobacterota bacterium]
MNIYPDCHFHTDCSDDAEGSVRDVFEKAAEKGITHLGFSNHLEYLNPVTGECEVVPERDIQRHLAVKNDIENVRRDFPDIECSFGVEIENKWQYRFETEDVTAALEPDFIIASVHMIGRENISSAKGVEYMRNTPEDIVYNSYFDEVLKVIDWGAGMVLGHLDLVKRYGTGVYGLFDPEKYLKRLEEVISELKSSGMFMEINCSGIFQDPGESYPGNYIFSLLKDAGISALSFGSDSHSPKNIGRGVRKTVSASKSAGIRDFVFIRNGKPEFLPLGVN